MVGAARCNQFNRVWMVLDMGRKRPAVIRIRQHRTRPRTRAVLAVRHHRHTRGVAHLFRGDVMTHPHDRALEAAYEAAAKVRLHLSGVSFNDPQVAESFRELIRAEARAAVTAYLAAELEQGRAMMPRKATEEMTSHGFKARDELQGKSFPRAKLPDAMWTAMFDAAPPAAQDHRP